MYKSHLLTLKSYNMLALLAMERANQPFTYRYVYNIMSTVTSPDVDSIIVNWPRAHVRHSHTNGSN